MNNPLWQSFRWSNTKVGYGFVNEKVAKRQENQRFWEKLLLQKVLEIS